MEEAAEEAEAAEEEEGVARRREATRRKREVVEGALAVAAAQVAGHRWLTSAEDWEAERWVHPDAHGGATGGAALATPDAGSEAAREVVGRARPFPVMSFSPW